VASAIRDPRAGNRIVNGIIFKMLFLLTAEVTE